MALYEALMSVNVMNTIADRLTKRQMTIDPDTQRVEIQSQSILPKPWILSGIDYYRQCSVWKDFIFDTYQIIPKGCRSCWKICYKPRTLDELFAVYKLQQKMKDEVIEGTSFKYHMKCGVERRPYVGNQGGYAAFWYNPLCCDLGIARKIRTEVAKHVYSSNWRKKYGIDADPKIILKRGCTEMELTYSPSDTWDSLAEENNWDEKLPLIQAIAPKYKKPMVEDYQMSVIHAQTIWIEHAEQYGDRTYLNHKDKPFRPNLMNYTGSLHNDSNEFETWDQKAPFALNKSLRSCTETKCEDIVADLDEQG